MAQLKPLFNKHTSNFAPARNQRVTKASSAVAIYVTRRYDNWNMGDDKGVTFWRYTDVHERRLPKLESPYARLDQC